MIASLLSVTVVACGGTWQRQTYDVALDTDTAARRVELLMALEQVATRRLLSRGIEAVALTSPKGNGGTLTISNIATEEAGEEIRALLAEPFTFDVRYEVIPEATEEDAEQPVPAWESTPLNGSHLTWIEVLPQEDGTASAELQFNEEGRRIFNELLAEEDKDTLGIFVRDFLVSKVTISASQLQERILISGIPSVGMATVFAEDVNVGLHVKLTPR